MPWSILIEHEFFSFSFVSEEGFENQIEIYWRSTDSVSPIQRLLAAAATAAANAPLTEDWVDSWRRPSERISQHRRNIWVHHRRRRRKTGGRRRSRRWLKQR
jgi:hypothetical protein